MKAVIKVVVILGTRPEAIKLAPVILALQQAAGIHLEVALTGQHREMVDQVMALFGIQADVDLDIMQPHQSLTDITERSLRGLDDYLQGSQPDWVVVQGDTTTAFAAALAAFYHRIPVAHVEAGLRTHDLLDPFPEEANRRLISQLATLHFAPTTQAVDNLKRANVVGQVILTGNTVIDALLTVASQDPVCEIKGLDWSRHRVLLATLHRRENWGSPLESIADALLEILAQAPDVAMVIPLHRNPTVREPLQAKLGSHPRVFLTEPMDYRAWVGAMKQCHLILSDSGGIQEEAPALGKPVLVLRRTTERPEAIAAGTAQLAGTDPDVIVAAVLNLLGNPDLYSRMAHANNPFGDGTASQQIVSALLNTPIERRS
ncbi:MAG: UDP-N-acetylglucosamine 2-epimerase (non-hydrolyzing) [Synechococcaceae cyanobacterium SM2_3_2]|nr:UDP-N-acetylglucosamine 2-epimerase (non-hydrolyzing) [Synechococcaceae cyanobacterium SM2_3_2]